MQQDDDVQQDTYEDDEEDLGGSGGSGGGGGSRGGGGLPPSPPIPVVRMGNMTGMPIIEVITNPHQLSTAVTTQLPSASPSTPTPTPPPVVTRSRRSTQTTVTVPVPVPPGPVIVAQPMPSSPYICTVSEPVRSNLGYLPTDGLCDYLFFDSLYKTFKSRFIHGVKMMEASAQYFVSQATRYSKTKFGLSFSPEYDLFTDYKERAFFNTLDEVWSQRVSHFGFLDLYREFTRPDTVLQALEVLKELYKHLEPNFSAKRPSYYVVAMAPDSKANDQIINFIQKVFTPSMFIAVAHISYPLRLFSDCLIFPVAMETLPEFVREIHDYYGHSVVSIRSDYEML
ncbi:uncharacterized protein LOC119403443 [Rhipicephalus sanguineus]|uniref:uncharacterized protein LOC119403443 n=1 Tax=Rhipicephalus sanguineus TaxID=34632 RepID=UPI0020C334C9|nr:uncharacterized protein LOC119403443 [Rhipicephalus sanguineus]